MKRFFKAAAVSAAAIATLMFSSSIASFAATVDDVAATARSYGIPENFIQQGYNEYYKDPSAYTSEDFAYAIDYLNQYHDEVLQKLLESVPSSGSQGSAAGSGDDNTETTDWRIPEEEFSGMTLDEKRNYLAGLNDQQREEFLNSLSPEELKSVVKQLSTGAKADILDKFVQAGDKLGINVTVDEVTDDDVSITMRDDNGEVLDKSSFGIVVEDTGYDYRLILSVCGLLLLGAGACLSVVIKKCFGGKGSGESHE